MKTLNEQLEELAELQKKSLEPFAALSGDAVAAYERVARKNQELIGDVVDFTVAQSRNQLEGDNAQTVYERQLSEARAFAEKIRDRATEYAELATELRDTAMSAIPAAVSRSAETASSSDKTPARKAASRLTAKGGKKPSTTTRPAAKKATAKKSAAGKATKKKPVTKKAVAKKTGAKKSASTLSDSRTPRTSASTKSSTSKKATRKKAAAGSMRNNRKSASTRRTA